MTDSRGGINTDGTVRGRNTGVDLGDVRPLLLPWERDPWDQLRPPVSLEAMQLSAEMARTAYTMSVEDWMAAGWQDATLHIDGRLTPVTPGSSWLQSRWQRLRVRGEMLQVNPVRHVRSALRQRHGSDTGKAVVMIHPAPLGRYVVSVSFMGTGVRFYDWFSNFRMTTLAGVHKGFQQLAEQFEGMEEEICFPATAAELGLERLTLRHVLQEMRSASSRFTLWLSGHSQGGAVMQVYAHRKLRQDGVHPMHLLGYGFASPTVMSGDAVQFPAAYPLYHIHNSDDVIPRCGAAVHLGMCLTCPADMQLRRACYGWPRDAASVQARLAARSVMRRMNDSPGCILQGMAWLTLLGECSAEEILQLLGGTDTLIPLARLMESADVQQLLEGIRQRASAAYRCLTGQELSANMVQQAAEEMRRAMAPFGMRRFTEALLQLMRWPHSMKGHVGESTGAYFYIVTRGVQQLVPGLWQSGWPARFVSLKDVPRATLPGETPGR